MSERRWRDALLLLALLAAGVHGGTLRNEFAYDDKWAIERNPVVAEPWNLARHVSTGLWGERYERGIAAWRPLATLTLAWNHALGGLDPAGYHAANLLLHGLATLLLALLAVDLGLARPAALAAAAVFALHPIHVDAIATGVGRADLLLAVCGFAALRAWERRRTAPALVWLGLALLSKEMAATLAAVMVWRDLASGERSRRWLLPLLAVALWLPARYAAVGSLGIPSFGFLENPLAGADFATRLWTAGAIYGRVLGLFAWPAVLLHEYSYATLEPLAAPNAAALWGLALLVASAAGAAWSFWRRPALSTAIVLWLFPWLLVSHLGPPPPWILAERVLYLPSAGLCLLLGFAVQALARRGPARGRRAGALLLAAACVALAVRSAVRVSDWRNDATLVLADARSSPRSVKLQVNAALVHRSLGERDAARAAIARALAVHDGVALPHLVAASFAIDDGDRARAQHHLERGAAGIDAREVDVAAVRCSFALRFTPEASVPACEAATRAPLAEARTWVLLALAYERAGSLAEAERAFAEAFAREPSPSVEMLYNHGVFLARRGRLAEARARLERARERAPQRAAIRRALAGLDAASASQPERPRR